MRLERVTKLKTSEEANVDTLPTVDWLQVAGGTQILHLARSNNPLHERRLGRRTLEVALHNVRSTGIRVPS